MKESTVRNLLQYLLSFSLGVLSYHFFAVNDFQFAFESKECFAIHAKATFSNRSTVVAPGIYPLLRDFHCGHSNMETPRLIGNLSEGRQRVVVDVGLDEGGETLDAVEQGFVVFGFEMRSASVARVKENAIQRGLHDRIHFVQFKRGETHVVPKFLPRPPTDGKGFAYIFNAGLSDTSEEAILKEVVPGGVGSSLTKMNSTSREWMPGMVPILKLEDVLPSWVGRILFLKIDTQGFEPKVLRGADTLIRSNRVQYVQYEFSPKLMRQADTGEPLQLLQYLIGVGAVCFDMMGVHHVVTRPSKTLEQYLRSLDSGKNSVYKAEEFGAGNYPYDVDEFGAWDDILCWFPDATT